LKILSQHGVSLEMFVHHLLQYIEVTFHCNELIKLTDPISYTKTKIELKLLENLVKILDR
jgi:hypothetical protein